MASRGIYNDCRRFINNINKLLNLEIRAIGLHAVTFSTLLVTRAEH